jgi:hypothetical protein
MGKRLLFILFLGLLLSACTVLTEPTAPSPPISGQSMTVAPSPTVVPPSPTAAPVSSATPAPAPVVTNTVPPTAAATETSAPPTMTLSPEGDLALAAEDVFLSPVPAIYDGDQVTFWILPHVPPSIEANEVDIRIDIGNQITLPGSLNQRNLPGDAIGLFNWAWDTEGMMGEHQVIITLDPADKITAGDENPNNNQVVLTVPVLSSQARPPREALHAWHVEETNCCRLRVIEGTAAYRDLDQLKQEAEIATQKAVNQLGVMPDGKIDLFFVDRVLGQGGYATSQVVISYLDRNYSGGGLHEVLAHEIVHLLDRQFAPSRNVFLAEGLAVWVSGGHYKQEDLDQRMKALHEAGLYVPLAQVIDNFYAQQHEIAYLEAAGFIKHLADTYGWQRVRDFYGDVRPIEAESDSQAIERSLMEHFSLTIAQVEASMKGKLDAIPLNSGEVADLTTSIRYYDLMREYQLQYDPTAHYQRGWFPWAQELEKRQLTADVARRPNSDLNVTLEVMLNAVDRAINAEDYNRANVILDSVERALTNNGNFNDPLGASYLDIVSKLRQVGFEVHQVELYGNEAVVQVTEGTRTTLRPVTMALKNQSWVLLN